MIQLITGDAVHICSIHDAPVSVAHLNVSLLFVFPAVIPRFLNAVI